MTDLAPRRRAMAVRAFLCQNIVVGCSFGGFPLAMGPLRETFQVGTGTAALCISIALLAGGLASPLAAASIDNSGVRATMLMGALLTVLGYLTLAFAPTIHVVLAAYGLLGVGMALCGPLTANVLVNNWYQPHPGRAIGFVNMTVMVALVPLAMQGVIQSYGLSAFYLSFAAVSTLLLPLIWGVADGPGGRQGIPQEIGAVEANAISIGGLLQKPSFWAVVVGGGILTASSIVTLSQIVALATERAIPAGHAMLLASVLGGATVLGSFGSGLLSDRIGGAWTLSLVGAGFCFSWILLLTAGQLPLLIFAAFLLGTCGGSLYPAANLLAGQLFGAATLPLALGLYQPLVLPFTFLLPPLAGLLRDTTGDYRLVAVFVVVVCGAASLLFCALAWEVHRRLGLSGAGQGRQPRAR